jgi:DNA-binding transcriptional ArsR family regulator
LTLDPSVTAAPDASFEALADPTRREILALLRDGGWPVVFGWVRDYLERRNRNR